MALATQGSKSLLSLQLFQHTAYLLHHHYWPTFLEKMLEYLLANSDLEEAYPVYEATTQTKTHEN